MPKTLNDVKRRSTTDENGCWIWSGRQTPAGYCHAGRGYAHRVAYEIAKGPIPPGITVDHICYVRNCVNPEHLRLLSGRENSARKYTGATHERCRNGHEYTPENTLLASGGTERRCKTCHHARRKSYRKQKAAQHASQE